ncbi:MAG: hypothetical protein FJY86_03180, partial [Candidatus Diapherotrites archaeon]|nr:hypothetical protein [Candidatus Diapherotrites archaeon]
MGPQGWCGDLMASTIVRIIWFLFIGWWLALVWVFFAFFACLTIIGLPVGLWMFSKTWKIATLAEDPMKIFAGASQQVQQVTVVNNAASETKSKESPLVSLKRKYADGDITKEEYL